MMIIVYFAFAMAVEATIVSVNALPASAPIHHVEGQPQ